MTVKEFIDAEYRPHVESSLAASTAEGYRKLWKAYAQYVEGETLELRVVDCQRILREICQENPNLNKSTIKHIKAFFSGVWTYAIRMGFTAANPWQHVGIPNAAEAGETHAYSPQEINAMLAAVPSDYYLLVLLAASTGLRKSEIRGLKWSDWNSEEKTLYVNRALWRKHEKPTKSRASKAPVSVVEPLAIELDERCGKSDAYIFPNSVGGALDLDNTARRFLVPALRKAEIRWYGWHAFRRGLATFLHANSVPDKEIQAILRHENVSTTQKAYVKTIPTNIRKAMAAVTYGGTK
jgi:integrase